MDPTLERLRGMLESLTEAEFRQAGELYRAEDARRHREALLSFRERDRVRFEDADGRTVTGTVERVNVKTVTVRADEGRRWRVAPQFLEPERRVSDAPVEDGSRTSR